MTLEERSRALEPLGFSSRQARFLALAALHSGYCLRRQYSAFAGVAYGKNVCDFLDSLVERRLARRFTQRADRGLIYHLHARPLYRALGDADNRNRREVSAAAVARKIMLLDFVLSQPNVEWLATEHDKVERLSGSCGVPRCELPRRTFAASSQRTPDAVRYFLDKLPIAVDDHPRAIRLAFLAIDASAASFERFLAEHRQMLSWFPTWSIVAVGTNPAALEACEAAFTRLRGGGLLQALAPDELRPFFMTRRVVENGDLSSLSVAAIDRFRQQRDAYGGPLFDGLYEEWKQRGDRVLTEDTIHNRPAQSLGQFTTARLAFDYSQFGSLPGVA